MEKYKKLKMSYPHIETFPRYANILSILQGNNLGEEWILNNFIEIYSNDIDLIFYDFNYFCCPFLVIEMISKKFLKYYNLDIIEVIKDNINNNKYAYFLVNEAYIPAYGKKKECFHDLFVYGYSNDENLFYIADCFAGGKYKYKTCTYKELEMAISTITEENEIWFDGCIYFMSLKESEYEFSRSRVISSIEDYLQGKPISCWDCDDLHGRYNIDELKFGIDTYKFLTEKVTMLKNNKYRANQIFTLFWDHKKHMCKIINYLGLEQFYDLMLGMEQNARILRNLYLKYTIKEDELILNKMNEILKKSENWERNIYPEIIKQIKI